MMASVLVGAVATCVAATGNPNLRYMMTYDVNLTAQADWITVISGSDNHILPDQMVAMHDKYPILKGMPQLPPTIFNRGARSLYPDWKAATEQFITEIAPGVHNGTFIGVFMGDEIVCGGTPLANMTAVADVLRARLPKQAFVYTNECSEMQDWPSIPASLDLISMDVYDEHNTNGSNEVAMAKDFFTKYVFPKLHPHQGVLVVPGIYASDPAHCIANNVSCPLGPQSTQVVAKLDGFFQWALSEPRIHGFNPWHFSNRSQQLGGAWDQALGAITMPNVVAKLRDIGLYMRNNN